MRQSLKSRTRMVLAAAALAAAVPAPALAAGELPATNIGVFLGITDAQTTEFTFGVEAEYHFAKHFGVGAVLETTPEGHGGYGVTMALAMAHLHPGYKLRLSGGIGAEFVKGKTYEVFRLAAAYEHFMAKYYLLAPTVAVDFVNGQENLVVGLVFGRSF